MKHHMMKHHKMKHPNERRFEEFFEEDKYVVFKNHLYNYRLRKRAIQAALERNQPGFILEVGSGLSPIITTADDIVYSELSFRALRTLKGHHGRGSYAVADGTRLPFKDDAFDHSVCSEVLEHVEDDQGAVNELARVMKPGGRLYLTVPHRKFYFAADDRFVGHFRRYELEDLAGMLETAGLRIRSVEKVLGPLEKATMLLAVLIFSAIQRLGGGTKGSSPTADWTFFVAPLFKWANRFYTVLVWLDARITPRFLATVILVQAEKGD